MDALLPFIGHLSTCVSVAQRPPSVLANVTLAVSSDTDRVNVLNAARQATSFLKSAVGIEVAELFSEPSRAAGIRRSLAIFDCLIGDAYFIAICTNAEVS